MACGCGTAPVSATTAPSTHVATRAAICQLCPHAERDARHGATACGRTGQPIVALVVRAAACPVGRHPDAAGDVRWFGVRWHGVPEPLRWRLVWMLGREPRGLVGCGCVARLKASRLGPWLEPWMDAVPALRARMAAALGDWAARERHHGRRPNA